MLKTVRVEINPLTGVFKRIEEISPNYSCLVYIICVIKGTVRKWVRRFSLTPVNLHSFVTIAASIQLSVMFVFKLALLFRHTIPITFVHLSLVQRFCYHEIDVRRTYIKLISKWYV